MAAATRSRYSPSEKARVKAILDANGGNVKRTARETGMTPQTVRLWKQKWEREGVEPAVADVLPAITADIVDSIVRVRDKALLRLEAAIDADELKGRDLIVAVGVLTDKERLIQGQATSRTENTSAGALPAEEVREMFKGLAAGMIEAAERRAATISSAVDGEEPIENAEWEQVEPKQLEAAEESTPARVF